MGPRRKKPSATTEDKQTEWERATTLWFHEYSHVARTLVDTVKALWDELRWQQAVIGYWRRPMGGD